MLRTSGFQGMMLHHRRLILAPGCAYSWLDTSGEGVPSSQVLRFSSALLQLKFVTLFNMKLPEDFSNF